MVYDCMWNDNRRVSTIVISNRSKPYQDYRYTVMTYRPRVLDRPYLPAYIS